MRNAAQNLFRWLKIFIFAFVRHSHRDLHKNRKSTSIVKYNLEIQNHFCHDPICILNHSLIHLMSLHFCTRRSSHALYEFVQNSESTETNVGHIFKHFEIEFEYECQVESLTIPPPLPPSSLQGHKVNVSLVLPLPEVNTNYKTHV